MIRTTEYYNSTTLLPKYNHKTKLNDTLLPNNSYTFSLSLFSPFLFSFFSLHSSFFFLLHNFLNLNFLSFEASIEIETVIVIALIDPHFVSSFSFYLHLGRHGWNSSSHLWLSIDFYCIIFIRHYGIACSSG